MQDPRRSDDQDFRIHRCDPAGLPARGRRSQVAQVDIAGIPDYLMQLRAELATSWADALAVYEAVLDDCSRHQPRTMRGD